MSTTIGGIRIVDMPDLGTVDDGSSMVGERIGSGRFAAPALRDYVTSDLATSVKRFGATGNGSTDDTSAFNAALAWIATQAGGKLYIPAGHYKLTGALTYANGYLHVEGSGPGTELDFNNPAVDMMTFSGSDITVSDLQVRTPYQASTYGSLFNFANANNIRIDRVSTDGGFDVVAFHGAPGKNTYRANITNCHFDNVMNNAVFYDPYFGGIGIISDTEMLAAPNNTNGNGIIAEAGDTFTWVNINIQGFPEGIEITSQPGGINYVANIFAANVLCDGGATHAGRYDGWIFNGAAPGTYVARIYLSGCWAGSMQGNGFVVLNASHVTFANCVAIENGAHGFVLTAPSTAITLNGCSALQNSGNSANISDGVHVQGPMADFTISGCRSTATQQRYGIFVDASANDRYIITNNNLHTSGLSGGLSDGGTGATKFVSQNII